MKIFFIILILFRLSSFASIDLGVGSSSFTSGRGAPALALGVDSGSWALLYRSVGVQTTIYAQNSWTFAGLKNVYTEKIGLMNAFAGAGIGGSYMTRSYRSSPSATTESYSETVLGPHLLFKIQLGPTFLAFDTLLGLSSNVFQHVVLNFQDVSHVSFGISL